MLVGGGTAGGPRQAHGVSSPSLRARPQWRIYVDRKTKCGIGERSRGIGLLQNCRYLCITLTQVFRFMTKAEIVTEIAKATGEEKTVVSAVVEQFMECVKQNMIGGEPVYLRGFGSFILKLRAEKTARNISKGTTLKIPAHKVPAFKPAKSFALKIK